MVISSYQMNRIIKLFSLALVITNLITNAKAWFQTTDSQFSYYVYNQDNPIDSYINGCHSSLVGMVIFPNYIGGSSSYDVTYAGNGYGPVVINGIGDGACQNQTQLTNAIIPNGYNYIGYMAFSGCANLISISLPNSVKNIGQQAFNASGLQSISLPSGLTSVSTGLFQSCHSLTNVVIPYGVTNIGDAAFIDCPKLTTVIIPSTVTSIGSSVFEGCFNLTNIFIPASVTNYGGSNITLISVGNANTLTSILDTTLLGLGFSVAQASAWGQQANQDIIQLVLNNIPTNQSLTGPTGPQGPVGVFDPTVLTNTDFLNGLASNTTFLLGLSNQIATRSNNLGIATKVDIASILSQNAGLSNALNSSVSSQGTSFSNSLSNSIATLNTQTTAISNALANSIASSSLSLSNALASSIASQGSSFSNSLTRTSNTMVEAISSNTLALSNVLISSINSQTAGVSNALATSLAAQGSSLSNALASSITSVNTQSLQLSNTLSGAIISNAQSLSNAVSTASALVNSQISTLSSALNNAISAGNSQSVAISNTLSTALATLAAQTSPTNPAFISAIASQILAATNNDGLAVKQNQSLNFPAIPAQTITPTATVTLNVTSSANQIPIIYSSGNTAVATVSNNVLKLIGSGSTTITASQAGNSLYNPISASQPLLVNKSVQTINFAAIPNQTYSTFKSVTLKSSSSAGLSNSYIIGNGAIGSISNNVLLLLGTGSTTITATNSGNAYFAPASATQTLNVK